MTTTDLLTTGQTQCISSVAMTADSTQAIAMHGARHARIKLTSAAPGSRAGVIYIQESQDGATADNNCTLTNKTSGVVATSITVTTSTLLDAVVDIETDAPFLIIFFDYTSGSGTLNGYVTIKE